MDTHASEYLLAESTDGRIVVKWIKSNGKEWNLYRGHEWAGFSLVKKEGSRYLRCWFHEEFITKETFHYYHQHPDVLYMEDLL